MFSNACEKFGEDGNVRRRRYHGPKRREERPDMKGGGRDAEDEDLCGAASIKMTGRGEG